MTWPRRDNRNSLETRVKTSSPLWCAEAWGQVWGALARPPRFGRPSKHGVRQRPNIATVGTRRSSALAPLRDRRVLVSGEVLRSRLRHGRVVRKLGGDGCRLGCQRDSFPSCGRCGHRGRGRRRLEFGKPIVMPPGATSSAGGRAVPIRRRRHRDQRGSRTPTRCSARLRLGRAQSRLRSLACARLIDPGFFRPARANASRTTAGFIGTWRIRTPVASKNAFAIAGEER